MFGKVFANTFGYLLIGTPISLVLSFRIADLLDNHTFGQSLLRMLRLLPFMTSAVAMARVWRWFHQGVPIGRFNDILAVGGINRIDGLISTTNALPAVPAPAVRAAFGIRIIIFMVGLRAIPASSCEAARIDGVGWWTVLTEITIPLLRPAILLIVVFSPIGVLRVLNMTTNIPGGPLTPTVPLVRMIDRTAFTDCDMGHAAAQTVILFTILPSVSLARLRVVNHDR